MGLQEAIFHNSSRPNGSENHVPTINIIENVSEYDFNVERKGSYSQGLDPISPLPFEIDTDQNRFIFEMMRSSIDMDRMKYEYSNKNNQEPEYVRNADYKKADSDINIYLNQIKTGGYIRNPFALESTWK